MYHLEHSFNSALRICDSSATQVFKCNQTEIKVSFLKRRKWEKYKIEWSGDTHAKFLFQFFQHVCKRDRVRQHMSPSYPWSNNTCLLCQGSCFNRKNISFYSLNIILSIRNQKKQKLKLLQNCHGKSQGNDLWRNL